ncbi:hypothetical protein ACPRNU_24840 [Chromobacterium vaccinii]|uniref:hypothetical protein n=1 Tax=Chromobacterium vaccinii TaxID=1108595 RepID=UPI003C728B1B
MATTLDIQKLPLDRGDHIDASTDFLSSIFIDSSGTIYLGNAKMLSGSEKGHFYSITSDGTTVTLLNIDTNQPGAEKPQTAIAIAISGKKFIWVCDFIVPVAHCIDEMKKDTLIDLSSTNLTSSRGMTYDEDNKVICIAGDGGDAHGGIAIINAETKKLITTRTKGKPGDFPQNVIWDKDRKLIWASDAKSACIYYFDASKDDVEYKVVNLEKTKQPGNVYGLAVDKVNKILWALDAGGALYRIDLNKFNHDKPDDVMKESSKINVADLGASGALNNFWDIAIDDDGYIWLPCQLGVDQKVLLLSPEGNKIDLFSIVDAKSLDTIRPAQTYDSVMVVDRELRTIFQLSPNVSLDKVNKPPRVNPVPVVAKDLALDITAPKSVGLNTRFPEIDLYVHEKGGGKKPIPDALVDITIPKEYQDRIKVTDPSGHYLAKTGPDGKAIIPAGVLTTLTKEGDFKIQFRLRGLPPQFATGTVHKTYTISTIGDAPDRARRKGEFKLLTAKIVPPDAVADVEFAFINKSEPQAKSAHFASHDGSSPAGAGAPFKATVNKLTGEVSVKLFAGEKLGIIKVQVGPSDHINPPAAANFKDRLVVPTPTQLNLTLSNTHANQFVTASAEVMGLDDTSPSPKLIKIINEPLIFTLETKHGSAPITDKNGRTCFVNDNSDAAGTLHIWNGAATTDGLTCTLTSDAEGKVKFPKVKSLSGIAGPIPAIAARPLGATLTLKVKLEDPAPSVTEHSKDARIEH